MEGEHHSCIEVLTKNLRSALLFISRMHILWTRNYEISLIHYHVSIQLEVHEKLLAITTQTVTCILISQEPVQSTEFRLACQGCRTPHPHLDTQLQKI